MLTLVIGDITMNYYHLINLLSGYIFTIFIFGYYLFSTSKKFDNLGCQELKIVLRFNLQYIFILNLLNMQLHRWLISQYFMPLDDIIKIILNIWYGIRSIRNFKLFILCCSWYWSLLFLYSFLCSSMCCNCKFW